MSRWMLVVALLMVVATSASAKIMWHRVVRQDLRRCVYPLCGGHFVSWTDEFGNPHPAGATYCADGSKADYKTGCHAVEVDWSRVSTTLPKSDVQALYASGYLIVNGYLTQLPHGEWQKNVLVAYEVKQLPCKGCSGKRPPCIAPSCKKWYDGCNTCTESGCTERFCKTCGEPKCLDETCTPYTEEKACIALAGWCYNAGECKCGKYDTVNCFVDPCKLNSCKAGYECVANYCGGCNHMCVPSSCTPYTPPSPCIALAGWCYNAGECKCGEYATVNCFVDPCKLNSCKAGHKCVANYCGGCNHMCVPN